MPSCLRCLKVFATTKHLQAHLNQSKPCEPCGVDVSFKIIKCKYCNKEFDSQGYFNRHLTNVKKPCSSARSLTNNQKSNFVEKVSQNNIKSTPTIVININQFY